MQDYFLYDEQLQNDNKRHKNECLDLNLWGKGDKKSEK